VTFSIMRFFCSGVKTPLISWISTRGMILTPLLAMSRIGPLAKHPRAMTAPPVQELNLADTETELCGHFAAA
jgi:hypothetical protein